MCEIWKDIFNYEGLYQVSNYGRVKSLARTIIEKCGKNNRSVKGRILKLWDMKTRKTGKPYKSVSLSKNGKAAKFTVHRLVAEAFIENKENKPFINHKDGVKHNNKTSNLEWCTNIENIQHAIKTGIIDNFCEKNHQSKLTREQGIFVLRNNAFYRQKDLAEKFGVKRQSIGDIAIGRTWKKLQHYNGYHDGDHNLLFLQFLAVRYG